MTGTTRAVGLVLAAMALIAAVLGVQLAHGGGDFVTTATLQPCEHRKVTSVSGGIEGLGEQLVLLGLDGAACRLGTSREALTLQLAQQRTPTDREVSAIRAGLLGAVERMKDAGTLPKVSDLADEALDNADLNGFLKAALRAIPDSLIDDALKTDDVLRRTIEKLDIRSLLTNLDDPDELNGQINKAVTDSVKDALVDKLRDLI